MLPRRVRGCCCLADCSRHRAGGSPVILSTSGFSGCSIDCLVRADRQSRNRLRDSAKSVSKAKEDLPEPDGPQNTISLFEGRLSLRFLRLCWRAPLMEMGWFMSRERCECSLVCASFFNDEMASCNIS